MSWLYFSYQKSFDQSASWFVADTVIDRVVYTKNEKNNEFPIKASDLGKLVLTKSFSSEQQRSIIEKPKSVFEPIDTRLKVNIPRKVELDILSDDSYENPIIPNQDVSLRRTPYLSTRFPSLSVSRTAAAVARVQIFYNLGSD